MLKTWVPELEKQWDKIFPFFHKSIYMESWKRVTTWREEGERKRRRVDIERWGEMKQAAENPAMTAVTREQHAKQWKSFPASSKAFMGFSVWFTSQGVGRDEDWPPTPLSSPNATKVQACIATSSMNFTIITYNLDPSNSFSDLKVMYLQL